MDRVNMGLSPDLVPRGYVLIQVWATHEIDGR